MGAPPMLLPSPGGTLEHRLGLASGALAPYGGILLLVIPLGGPPISSSSNRHQLRSTAAGTRSLNGAKGFAGSTRLGILVPAKRSIHSLSSLESINCASLIRTEISTIRFLAGVSSVLGRL